MTRGIFRLITVSTKVFIEPPGGPRWREKRVSIQILPGAELGKPGEIRRSPKGVSLLQCKNTVKACPFQRTLNGLRGGRQTASTLLDLYHLIETLHGP